MEYNTSTSRLILPEYGRNIQKLVQKAVAIEDREERNIFAQNIIDLMGQMYPHLRDINDYKHKLWIHLALMSEFKLDIDYPYEIPKTEEIFKKPEKLEYTQSDIKLKHYGKVILKMAHHIGEMPDGDEKNNFLLAVASHMKKQFLLWNREVVDDDQILEDLLELSDHRINIPKGTRLTGSKELVSSSSSKNNKKKKKNDQSKSTNGKEIKK